MIRFDNRTLSLPKQGIGVLYGERGNYKSFVAQTLAMNMAIRERVLYMTEGTSPISIQRRMKAWELLEERHGIEYCMAISEGKHPDYRNADEWKAFWDYATQKGIPSLIVIDDFHFFVKGDIDSMTDVNQVLAFLEGLSDNYGCFILLVCNSPRNGMPKGSSLLTQVAGTMFEVTKKGDNALIRVTKSLDGKSRDYQLQGVKIGDSLAFGLGT